MCLAIVAAWAIAAAAAQERPNILWLTGEDNGPQLGCYGDDYATTPHIDALAARGMIYSHAWSNAPVCAPARTAIISGLFPTATGSQHMRSTARLPAGLRLFPQHLRAAGYYCTNNSKEDYNLVKPGEVWDASNGRAHWRGRRPGQPFFAVFNFTVTHEARIRKRPHRPVHDPAEVRVPAYHPDTPEVRTDWAQYYDKLTEMDAKVGEKLRELEADGLADSTIVFYFGDHGPGMPRSKRWPFNSGLHVPMVVAVPEKFSRLAPDLEVGGASERLVSFVDLAPTTLSLAGVEPPDHLHGHAFMGEHATDPQQYSFGFRDRMDERYDLVRTVRDARYVYLRHYAPHRIYGQHVAYMFETPTTRIWKQRYDAGELDAAQRRFWETKPSEELYDLREDPDEVRNLAGSAAHSDVLARLRAAHREHVLRVRDLGFLPEDELHTRSEGSTPYELGRDRSSYPLDRILRIAGLATRRRGHEPQLIAALADTDSAVRYWGVVGLSIRGREGVGAQLPKLRELLDDSAPSVRVAAAEALATFGASEAAAAALATLLRLADVTEHGPYVAMQALNAIDRLDDRCQPHRRQIAALPTTAPGVPRRLGNYVGRLITKTLADLRQE